MGRPSGSALPDPRPRGGPRHRTRRPLPSLDRSLEQRSGGSPLTFAFGGGPAAARDLLAAIAGSLISITGLTFSLTVVALELASSQYSPRVLQTFVTDRAVQLTLAQLVATFGYALTVLRTVRTQGASALETAYVPRLSITVAYVFTVGSVLALLLFLAHLSGLLRVETTLRDVHAEAQATAERELRDRPAAGPALDLPSGPGIRLLAASNGFLVDVDERTLVQAASSAGGVLLLAPRFGDSVVAGIPVAHAWPGEPGAELDLPRLRKALDRALRLHFERLPSRDVAYGLRKVVDVAVRALSSGVNDPTTAVHALAHVSALARRPPRGAATRRRPPGRRRRPPPGDHDVVRRRPAEPGAGSPLQSAAGQPAVLRRLAALLREVAWLTPRGPPGRNHAAIPAADLGDRRRLHRGAAGGAPGVGGAVRPGPGRPVARGPADQPAGRRPLPPVAGQPPVASRPRPAA